MVSEDDTPIIIDLGFHRHFSKIFISRGIYRWIDEDFTISKRRYVEATLIKLWEQFKKK